MFYKRKKNTFKEKLNEKKFHQNARLYECKSALGFDYNNLYRQLVDNNNFFLKYSLVKIIFR